MASDRAAEDRAAADPETAYRAFRAVLRRYLARRIGPGDEVEDALQEVFLRVGRNRAALAAAEAPAAWLHVVARSVVIDRARRRRRDAALAEALRREAAIDGEAGPEAEAGDDGFAACLAPLLAGLPPRSRAAVRAVDLDGVRQTALAEAEGVPVSTIKARVRRGRARLRAAILACCRVERGADGRVASLERGACGPACCDDRGFDLPPPGP